MEEKMRMKEEREEREREREGERAKRDLKGLTELRNEREGGRGRGRVHTLNAASMYVCVVAGACACLSSAREMSVGETLSSRANKMCCNIYI